MKNNIIVPTLVCLFFIIHIGSALSNDLADEDMKIIKMDTIIVRAKNKTDKQIIEKPGKSVVNLENYKSVSIAQNPGDIVKELVIMDYRGATDLVPDDDTLYMRGFSGKRFVTAVDGSTIRKTGGRRSSHIVDYALIPPFLIDTIDVMPGPHSALFSAKSIGGVVNFMTREPEAFESFKPDFALLTSFGSYGTQNHHFTLKGGAGNFVYDLGYQQYSTNGYLRNNKADISTFFSRISYLLPVNGYFSFTTSYTDADRQIPVNNDPDDAQSNWDNDYPIVSKASRFYDWQSPTWDKNAIYYRLNFKLPSQIGTWNASAYYGKENRDYSMMEWKDRKDHSKGIQDGSWETIWHQQGCKISNQFQPAKDHVVTVGGELEQLYDGYGNVPGWNNTPLAHDDKKRIETLSTFIQDRWSIMPNLTLTTGLRYEDDTILVKNYSTSSGNTYITGRKMWIKRSWSELIPKSFLTYELDDLAKGLRDTSISIGVSKIWRAPDYHGDYNPQGKPAGAWLDPEHGIGYDLVFNRRLFNNINMKFNYSYSQIKDYIAQNNSYSKYWPRGGKAIKPGLEYMDYKINLDEVIRQGIEIQLNGNITDDLDFLLGYAWQDFNNQGNEPAGKTELDNRPTDQVFAKLVYKLFNPTKLILEYEYQSEQIIVKADKIAADVHEFSEIAIDSFHLFNFGVEQTLFSKWNSFSNGVLKLYVKNLFGEDYKNATGYPATDRTFGIAFSFSI